MAEAPAVSRWNCWERRSWKLETTPTESSRLSPLLLLASKQFEIQELLKYGAEDVASVLLHLLFDVCKTNKIPSNWMEVLIISIPKKGDLSRSCNEFKAELS